MRFLTLSLGTLIFLANICSGQTIDVRSPSLTEPLYRPALVGKGPTALINQINEKELAKKGQKAAVVMFNCCVRKDGKVIWAATYQGSPDSTLLEQEVLTRLNGAKFIPAIYNHVRVDAMFYGSVTFTVVSGKPRLRIFANQETAELKVESDFVEPQPFFGNESKFTGWHYPPSSLAPVDVNGAVNLSISVTNEGILDEASILDEEPPLLGFGEAAIGDIHLARFIPAFRDGKPVAAKVVLPVYFKRSDDFFK